LGIQYTQLFVIGYAAKNCPQTLSFGIANVSYVMDTYIVKYNVYNVHVYMAKNYIPSGFRNQRSPELIISKKKMF